MLEKIITCAIVSVLALGTVTNARKILKNVESVLPSYCIVEDLDQAFVVLDSGINGNLFK